MMTRTLISEGILHRNLYHVTEPYLVELYNRGLEAVIQKKTALTEFHLDMRGMSPEIEAELGKNYLQCDPSSRYMIIVSPNQQHAGLLHQEFSFDYGVMSSLYEMKKGSIGIATRVDCLYGELNDLVRLYNSVEDLLSIKHVEVDLHTPSKFMSKARELQQLVKDLKADYHLLFANNAQAPRKILELVGEVGDVKDYSVDEVKFGREIGSFYTRLFDGIYIFRPKNPTNTVPIHRPGKKVKALAQHTLDTMTTMIYANPQLQPSDGPSVRFFPMNDPAVIDFLVQEGYAQFSPALIDQRLTRIEDLTMIEARCDITTMSDPEKQRALHDLVQQLPQEWHELKGLKTRFAKGIDSKARESYAALSVTAQASLLEVAADDTHCPHHITQNLLTKLWPHDYEQMLLHNTRDLEHTFDHASPQHQEYIISILKTAPENGGVRL